MSDFIISEPLLVSLDDYVPEGGGATGDSFYLKTDPTVLLKLFHKGKTQQSMDELRLSHLVYNTGIVSRAMVCQTPFSPRTSR